MQRDVSCIDCNDNESPINRGYSGSFIDIERTKLFSNFYSILNFVRENEQVCFEYIKKKKKKRKNDWNYYIDPRGIDLDFEKHQIDTIYVMRMVEG